MIVLQGMCYSGKTTCGGILARELGIPFLDSRDLFQRVYNMSETEYLTKYGVDKFCTAEADSLREDLGNIVLSLGGSACYYNDEMTRLSTKHTIVWLNVDFNLIGKRKKAEGKERPIVFPKGIESIEDLFNQRRPMYKKYANVTVNVSDAQPPCQTVASIVDGLP